MNQQPHTAYLFDVDGVLTSPEAKRVKQPDMFDELVKRLERLEPIGLNTGRSLDFIIEQVLGHIESRITNIKLLQNLFAIGEKGGVRIVYNESGQRVMQVDEHINVPKAIQKQVKSLVSQATYSETMFYDETKLTMISVELLPAEQMKGVSFSDFKAAQKKLTIELHTILSKSHRDGDLRVDPTRIATDIENVHAGKALGARQFVELLREKGIYPEQFLVFGDSISDYDMAEELHRLGLSVEFVFVGGRELREAKNTEAFLVTFTQGHCDEGTIEYLKSMHLH